MPRELSPQAREKLSRLAKERHAEGRFGGPQPGSGRPRGGTKKNQRITKAVAEAAEEEKNTQAIISVFKDAVHPSQPMSVRLKGATAWAEIARDHQKMELSQEAHQQAVHSRDELLELLASRLSSGPTASILRERMAGEIEQETGIVDATLVEEEDHGSDAKAA